MALQTVTLTWDFTDLIQVGEAAIATITPTARLTDTADDIIIPAVPHTVYFTSGTGQLAGIVANDNVSISPSGTGYTVVVTQAGGTVLYSQTVIINHANGATQDLSTLGAAQNTVTYGAFLPVPQKVNAQATVTGAYTLPDVTIDTVHRLVLTGNATLTLPAPGAGKTLTAVTVQDATGGRTITWATPSGAIKWAGGSAPTYTTTAAAVDGTSFLCVDGTNWLGVADGLNYH